jgi:hypothetical protein
VEGVADDTVEVGVELFAFTPRPEEVMVETHGSKTAPDVAWRELPADVAVDPATAGAADLSPDT